MNAVETGLLAVVALLGLVVVALVRAQASTARRLAVVERHLLRAQRRQGAPPPAREETSMSSTEEQPDPSADDGDLVDVRGVTVAQEPMTYPLQDVDRPTLVAFLSTTCGICVGLWEQLRDQGLDGVPAVVVTKDPAVENLAMARDMANAGTLPVIMSSEAWDDYEVPGSPYFLLVGGRPGQVLAEGEASTWESVRSLTNQTVG